MLPGMAVGTWAAMKNMDEKETYEIFLDELVSNCKSFAHYF